MPLKTAYVPIKYMVWGFQKGKAPNCRGSRFWENWILSFYWSKIKIWKFENFELDCSNAAYTCFLALENNLKRNFWKINRFSYEVTKWPEGPFCIIKFFSQVHLTKIYWCYGYALGYKTLTLWWALNIFHFSKISFEVVF